MDLISANLLGFAITVFTGFFAIMNPIANLPIYVGLVDGATPAQKKKVSKKAVFTAFFIVTAFVILGKLIFSLFGLTVPAFKIAGGILIFMAGNDMVRSKRHEDIKGMKIPEFNETVAISPLATPLMAGPGTIATAMSFVSDSNWIHMVIVVTMFAAVCALHYIAFSMSGIIVKKLGQSVIAVIGKIMGLIIAVIGTSMVIDGIHLAILAYSY